MSVRFAAWKLLNRLKFTNWENVWGDGILLRRGALPLGTAFLSTRTEDELKDFFFFINLSKPKSFKSLLWRRKQDIGLKELTARRTNAFSKQNKTKK